MNRQPQDDWEVHNDSDESIDDLLELQHEAQLLQQQFAVDGDQLSGQVGTDGADAVQVTVGGDGRVTEVQVSGSWRSAVAENQLEDAVLEAVTNAGMHRLATWTDAVANPDEENATGRDDFERASAPPPQQPSRRSDHLADGREARAAANEVLSLLEGIEDAVDSFEQRVTQAANQSVDGHSPSHTVTVSATSGGQVTGVTIQRRFLRNATTDRIERELYAAFQDAYHRAGVLTISTAMGEGKLARIQELVQQQASELGRNDD